VIKNKVIQFSTLFFAWAIIFAHSIIPHNHHNEPIEQCKAHSHACHSSNNNFSGIGAFFSIHQPDADDHNHCHFNISTTLTKYVDAPNAFFYSESIITPLAIKTQIVYSNNNDLLLKHFYFDSFSHRGPPSFS